MLRLFLQFQKWLINILIYVKTPIPVIKLFSFPKTTVFSLVCANNSKHVAPRQFPLNVNNIQKD